jgi:voltage-gated potassium channel
LYRLKYNSRLCDIRPLKKVSKVLSVFIALVGIMLTGIMLAVTLNTVSVAFEKHVDKRAIERVKEKFDSLK